MVRLIFSIIFFIVLAIFIALNAQYTTSVNFFSYTLDNISIAAVVTVTLAVGVVYSFMLYLSSYFAKSRAERLKQLKMKNKQKESELAQKAKAIDLTLNPPKSKESGKHSRNGLSGSMKRLFRRSNRKSGRISSNDSTISDAAAAESIQTDQSDE